MGKKLGDEVRKKLQQKTAQFLDKDKKIREAEEKKRQKQEEQFRIAQQRYHDWREQYKAQSEKSADIVWNWYQTFIDSGDFREIVKSLKDTPAQKLDISGILKCMPPDLWDANRHRSQKQFLYIDISNDKLFVHECGKYGKSYEIENASSLLEHVMPPILIAIAETITNNIIWDVLEIV